MLITMDVIANSDLDLMAIQFGHTLMESDLKQFEDSSDHSDTVTPPDVLANDKETYGSKPDIDTESYGAQNNTNLPHESSKVKQESNQYVCTDCGMSYSKQSSLSNHRLSKHAFVCSSCGSRFGVRANYESHVQFGCGRTAPAAQQLECMVCHKVLQSKKTLKKHLQHHYGIGEYRCKVCSRLFQQRTHLDQHMRTHDGQKPFACRLCGNSYTEKSSMTRHLRKIHGTNDPDLIENRVYEAVTASQAAAEDDVAETTGNHTEHYEYLLGSPEQEENELSNGDYYQTEDVLNNESNDISNENSKNTTEINTLNRARDFQSSEDFGNVLGDRNEIDEVQGNKIDYEIPEKLPIDEREELEMERNDDSLDESGGSSDSENFYDDEEEDETPGVPPPNIGEIITDRIKNEQKQLNLAFVNRQKEGRLGINNFDSTILKTPSKVDKPSALPVINKVLQNFPVSRDCHICGKVYSSPSALRKHVTRHEDENAYKCVLCKKSFPTTSGLQEHMRAHQFEKKIKCDFCKVMFTEKSTYRRHLRRFHDFTLEGARQYVHENFKELGPDDYLALMNGSTDDDDGSKDLTEEHETGKNKLESRETLGSFQNKSITSSELDSISQSHFNLNKKPNFETGGVGKVFSEKSYDKGKTFGFLPEPKVYDCHICGKLLGTGTSLRRHIKRHGDEFRCTVCKRNFSDSKVLHQHMSVHNQQFLICTVCGKPMTERSRYRSHLRSVHGFTLEGAQAYVDGLIDIGDFKTELKEVGDKGEHPDKTKNLEINDDDKTSVSENAETKVLDNSTDESVQQTEGQSVHSESVTSEASVDKVNGKMNVLFKNYDCPICGKQLGDASARSKHIRRHDGHVAFECEICHEAFPQIRLIESHVKTHTLRGAKCNVCLLYFADRSSARRHLVKIHGLSPNSNQIEDHMSDCHGDEDHGGYDALHYTVIDLKKHPDVKVRDCYNSVLSTAVYQKLYVTEKVKSDHNDLTVTKDELTLDNSNNTVEKLPDIDANIKTARDIKQEVVNDDLDMYINQNSSVNFGVTNKRKAKEHETEFEKKFKKEKLSPHLPLKIVFKRENKEATDENVDSPKFTIKDNEVDNDDTGSDKSYESDNTVDMDYDDQNEEKEGNEQVHNSVEEENQGYLRDSLKKDVALLDEEIRQRLLDVPSMFMPVNQFISDTLKSGETVANESAISEELDTSDIDSSFNTPKANKHHCFECRKDFSSYKSYRAHRRRLHPMTCDICNEKFLDLILYQSHIASHLESTRAKRYDCPVCGKYIKDASSRAKHLRLHTGEKPYGCEICGKRFTQTGHLASHSRLHSGEKPYDCRLCGKFFSEKSSVKRHLRKIHFNQYNKKCDVCSLLCVTREDYRDHMLSHAQNVYSCEICQKDFPDSKRLKLHNFNSHDKMNLDARTYTCKDCDKYFFSTKGLKNHVKRFHTEEIPVYNCALCSRTFLTTLTLESHMSTHRKKDLVCPTCNKPFRTNGSLSLHKKRHIISFIQKSEKTAEESQSVVDIKAKPKVENHELDSESENVDLTKIKSEPYYKIDSESGNVDITKIKSEPGIDEEDTSINCDNLGIKATTKSREIQKLIEDFVLTISTTAMYTNYCVYRPECILDTKQLEKYLVDSSAESGDQLENPDEKRDPKQVFGTRMHPRSLNVYKCNSCGLFLTTRKHLMRHVVALHKQKSVKCPMCSSK